MASADIEIELSLNVVDHADERLKMVYLDEHLIVDLLNGCRDLHCIRLPVTDDLPEGCRVVRVHHEPSRRALAAVIQHDSFDRVGSGTLLPVVDFIDRTVMLRKPLSVDTSWDESTDQDIVRSMCEAAGDDPEEMARHRFEALQHRAANLRPRCIRSWNPVGVHLDQIQAVRFERLREGRSVIFLNTWLDRAHREFGKLQDDCEQGTVDTMKEYLPQTMALVGPVAHRDRPPDAPCDEIPSTFDPDGLGVDPVAFSRFVEEQARSAVDIARSHQERRQFFDRARAASKAMLQQAAPPSASPLPEGEGPEVRAPVELSEDPPAEGRKVNFREFL